MNKIILGNGISAKIFALYNPEYVRIAPSGESQIEKKDFLRCAFLHRSSWADQFLYDIGMKGLAMDEDIQMGHYFKNIFRRSMPEGEVMELFLRKKMVGLESPSSLFPKESALAKPYLESASLATYNLRLDDVVETLNEKIKQRQIRDAKVTSIQDGFINLSVGQAMPYSHLVSTIPAPVFWEIYEGKYLENKVLYSSSLFLQTMSYSVWIGMGYPELEEKVICYFPEKKYPFDRAGRWYELYGDEVFIEGSVKFSKAVEIKGARLARDYSNVPPPNIMFLGRYAEWNPDIMIHNVIGRCLNKYMVEDIWSDQKSFNRKFVQYSPDISYVQGVIKDYLLHLMSETDSLLNTINWKIQDLDKTDIKVDRDAALEEWIDIFKFWLSIGLMFGFTPADFYDMYWDKTRRVKIKMKND